MNGLAPSEASLTYLETLNPANSYDADTSVN